MILFLTYINHLNPPHIMLIFQCYQTPQRDFLSVAIHPEGVSLRWRYRGISPEGGRKMSESVVCLLTFFAIVYVATCIDDKCAACNAVAVLNLHPFPSFSRHLPSCPWYTHVTALDILIYAYWETIWKLEREESRILENYR